jgi:hypothetical protein
LFSVNARTMRSWVLGERRIPEMAAVLVRLMLAGKIRAEDNRAS